MFVGKLTCFIRLRSIFFELRACKQQAMVVNDVWVWCLFTIRAFISKASYIQILMCVCALLSSSE